MVFNDFGFKEANGKETKSSIIGKILSVGYVLFALVGFLALLIALYALANADLGLLFFIFFGIRFSLVGIVAIGTIILGAVLRKNMRKTKIYFYSGTTDVNQEISFAKGEAKLFME